MADKDFTVKNGIVTGSNTLTVGTALTVNTTGIYRSSTLIANNTGPYGKTEDVLNVNSASYATTAGSATYATNAGTATYATNAGTANNSTYAYGKTESNLNVNNATTAYSKTEGNLNVNAAIYANGSSTNTFTVGTTAYFVSNGNVGIGTSSPDWKLVVSAPGYGLKCSSQSAHPILCQNNTSTVAYVDNSGNFYAWQNITAYASDERLKTNFVEIPNAIEKVKQLGGYTFDWLEEKCASLNFSPYAKHEHGLRAQEVQKVMEDAVTLAPFDRDIDNDQKSKSGENYLTIRYERLIPLLIQAIKEQQKQIDELKRGK